MLDRHADVVNANVRENLGGWIRSRLKNGVEARTQAAEKEISQTQLPVAELRAQWSQQRAAQLSVKAREYHPRLSYDLDTDPHFRCTFQAQAGARCSSQSPD